MDPTCSGQDVLRCDLCDTPVPKLHCDICNVNLCKSCVGEHVIDETKEHRVVPFKKRGSTIKCLTHSTKTCELFCRKCDFPICALCVSSFEHEQHNKVEIFKQYEENKAALHRDLEELENLIYPQFRKILSEIPIQRKDLKKNSQQLKGAIDNHGQNLHREIGTIIKEMKAQVDYMDSKHLGDLKEREDKITSRISEIEQGIADIKKLYDSCDVCYVCAYKPGNIFFKILPPKLNVSLPTFIPHQIDREEIKKQFGFLLELKMRMDSYLCDFLQRYIDSRPLMEFPRIISDITTEFGHTNKLCHVFYVSNREIWTSGLDEFIRLYILRGVRFASIKTMSGNVPFGIAVIRFDDLVYADYYDRSLNIVKLNGSIHTLVRLQGWGPRGVCTTSSDDLLVFMVNDSKTQSKVVRYSCSTEKQTIQYDNRGKPLYSSSVSSDFSTFICENKNFDICVADNNANAVVVVDQSGEFRFRYTPWGSFYPIGIVTDSQSRILISDYKNNLIHIIDHDGQFLRHIDNCKLQCPWGLSIDISDNLFVAEKTTGMLLRIRY